MEDSVFQEYLRCYRNPQTIHAICEDYRAAATIDLEDDKADSEKKIQCPLYLLWGARGTVGKLYDVVATWKDKALNALMIFPFLSPTATFCTLAVGFSALPAKAKVKKTSKRVSQQSEIIHP